MDKEGLINFFKKREVNVAMDFVRIALLLIAITILIVLLTNINEVKLLNSDACQLCMRQTGANCYKQIFP